MSIQTPVTADTTAKNTAMTLQDLIFYQISRRSTLKAASIGMMTTLFAGCDSQSASSTQKTSQKKTDFDFTPIDHGVDENIHISEGYQSKVLIRWGDPILKNAPEFNPHAQTADAQEQQFGFNNDFIGFFPLPKNAKNPTKALLVVNHEYNTQHMMFSKNSNLSEAEKNDICKAALGCSIIEIHKQDHEWHYIKGSEFNRRISMRSTKIDIVGATRGHNRMKTSFDPEGSEIIGTFQNCAGGMTPWGTYLTCEENIDFGFGNLENADKNNPEIQKYARFSLGKGNDPWWKTDARFDMAKTPTEFNRFGWIVEIDPYDPTSKPRKLTGLGRFKHEGCCITISHDHHIVAYMGDDQKFEFVYKFVSKNKYTPKDQSKNRDLLVDGTLYVAKFDKDGSVHWIALVHNQNGLTAENGFASQGDILIDARLAATFVGATPMDRPEGIAVHPTTGAIYISMSNNDLRTEGNEANPRVNNIFGHIVEINTNHRHSDTTSQWDILLFGQDTSKEKNVLACPDNVTFDSLGRLWASTDQGDKWGKITGQSDGLYAVSVAGETRGQASLFFRSPIGAETTGPRFTPDITTLFLSVQHPGCDGAEHYKGFERMSTFDDPATRWPDFDEKMPPRPSVIQIHKKGNVL